MGRLQDKTEVDTGSLLEADSAHMLTLINAANLQPGHTELPPNPQARDAFGYNLEVHHDDGRSSSIGFDYHSASPELKTLVDAIRKRGRSSSES
jgi:hypothetical protein